MQSSTRKHLLFAAESGDAAAQFNLGVFYDSRLDDNGYAIEGNPSRGHDRSPVCKLPLFRCLRH
jgi:TPR repeat protein